MLCVAEIIADVNFAKPLLSSVANSWKRESVDTWGCDFFGACGSASLALSLGDLIKYFLLCDMLL